MDSMGITKKIPLNYSGDLMNNLIIKIKNLMMMLLNKILFFNELYLFLFINLKFILNKN